MLIGWGVPESEPAGIYLSPKHQSFWFKGSFDIIDLYLGKCVVKTDVGSLPVALPDIDEPIHIVLGGYHLQAPPHFS